MCGPSIGVAVLVLLCGWLAGPCWAVGVALACVAVARAFGARTKGPGGRLKFLSSLVARRARTVPIELSDQRVGSHAKRGRSRLRLLVRDTAALLIANAYQGFPEGEKLPSTHDDVRQLSVLLRRARTTLTEYDLGADGLHGHLRRFLSRCEAEATGCCVYFSMHGIGGFHEDEYLVGNDGSMYHESRISAMCRGMRLPLMVAIIDTCHSGGVMNLPYNYVFYPERVERVGHKDYQAGPFQTSTPCVAISAVQEHQSAEAVASGSVFTQELCSIAAADRGQSLNQLMTNVSVMCARRTSSHNKLGMQPTVSINQSFVRMVSEAMGTSLTPEETLHHVTLY